MEIREKFNEVTEKAQATANDVWQFVKKHPLKAFAIASAGVAIANDVVKLGERVHRLKEDDNRQLKIWDASLGDWWEVRRALKPVEKLELENRIKNGESRGAILKDMGLLKK